MPCDNCKLDYPEDLLSSMITSDGTTKPVCGICALDMKNKIHGTDHKNFRGPLAEDMRLRAINWRKKRGIK